MDAVFHLDIGVLFVAFVLGAVPLLLCLAEAKNLYQQLNEEALDVSAGHYGVGELSRILVDLEVRPIRSHDQSYLVVEDYN